MNARIVEALDHNGLWIRILTKDIKTGQTIRMFESGSNNPVYDKTGKTEWIARSDAYVLDGTWGFDIDD